ncbi:MULTISPECIES: ADP-ribosylglycohydrolase family protein [Mycobacterium]|nr:MULTISPECIES: ADP-ribosylglycohydrolase family protein [Mycobacterium]BDE14795.1 ribosylglycohydrolase [Mycobacterium sp. 20KCMC460]GLC15783.1 ribosylglycohydrolase [Mycobacterium kiyosense]GLC22044.1 ribosylglycohydrolase [Mycobacterium kiyosense]GLD05333.1 ribosylglycohydrolase [Mycobacterium kiyosense]GLD25996.1 ribosylglycohydrolase [Mycobacterium kiyosense]
MAAYDDRFEGALLGMAAGDALGAPYEFGPPRGLDKEVAMVGGRGWEVGEWTDDTAMAIAIAEVAATGADLREESAQDAIVTRWLQWSRNTKDIGLQTSSVLRAATRDGAITAERARTQSQALHARTGRSGGNGSLMRTAPVALAHIDDEDAMVHAATAISQLTHWEPDAGEACIIWCAAIRHAVLTGELDARIGLRHLEPARHELWAQRLDAAEAAPPSFFANNGWVVSALQAAWSAISTTPVPADDPGAGVFRADHLRRGIDAAVRAGHDTDTVAAIAGALLGAAYGASAVPLEWRQLLNGWPSLDARGLVKLANAIKRQGKPDTFDYTYPGSPVDTFARHPYDDRVLLGGIGALRQLRSEVDAVVSLCLLADDDVRNDMPHVEVRLIDRVGRDENPHLDYVLLDAVRAVEQLRAEGRTVLVHCVGAYSRTPTIGALYGARLRSVAVDTALRDVTAVLPNAHPNADFRNALRRLRRCSHER